MKWEKISNIREQYATFLLFFILLRLLFCTVSVKRFPVLWFNKLPFIPRGIFLCIIEVFLKRS